MIILTTKNIVNHFNINNNINNQYNKNNNNKIIYMDPRKRPD